MMLIYDIIKFLDLNPQLTYKGIDWIQRGKDYKNQRQLLLNATDEIEKCIEWLSNNFVSNTKIVNPSSSYGLKHYVEKDYNTYISTGSFIAAVKILNINHNEYSGDSDIYMSFKKEYYKKYKEKHRSGN